MIKELNSAEARELLGTERIGRLLSRFPQLTPVESIIAEDAGAPTPVVFRIRIERITGICEGQ